LGLGQQFLGLPASLSLSSHGTHPSDSHWGKSALVTAAGRRTVPLHRRPHREAADHLGQRVDDAGDRDWTRVVERHTTVDGRLSTYDATNTELWVSHRPTRAAEGQLAIQSDGNLVIYSKGWQQLWAIR
jgi:hypothetical protein